MTFEVKFEKAGSSIPTYYASIGGAASEYMGEGLVGRSKALVAIQANENLLRIASEILVAMEEMVKTTGSLSIPPNEKAGRMTVSLDDRMVASTLAPIPLLEFLRRYRLRMESGRVSRMVRR